MRNAIVWLLLLLSSLQGYSQVILSGKLLDAQKQPVAHVSVTYKRPGTVTILGFTKSDEHGTFRLTMQGNYASDSVQLDFNHLGYARKSMSVANKTANYTVVLQEEVRQIEEVSVSDMPIFRRKDTINFNVETFTANQDRVIADIIKKLPGIEMQGDRILYQGKPIQKYMVNNLDLMEGRYAMINNNLPADAVKKVQIVENDQPIKILDSLVFSDQASLNLELKKFTTTGTGKVGAGGNPMLWDVNLTPMVFGRSFQMLSSIQTNNIGHDATKDLRAFYTGGGSSFSARSNVGDAPSYISLRNVSTPGFDEKKWNENKLFLFSTNVLKKLNNGLELKGNISYYDDTRLRQGFTATQYFTSEETIFNTEAIDNRLRLNVFDAGVLLEKNEKDIYLRNVTKYHKRWNNDLGNVVFNEDDLIRQRRAYTDEALMNSLTMARFVGKQLVNIRSVLEWHNTPQQLLVSPGQFTEILNNGLSFETMGQYVLYDGLEWNNGIGFTRAFKKWRFSPDFSINYDQKKLDSYVAIEDGIDDGQLGDGYINVMRNARLQLAVKLGVGWESSRWKFLLQMPYQLNYYNVTQQGETALENVIRNTVTPLASLTYLPNGDNEWILTLSGGNEFGGLDNFYNSYIISQYRSMQRYEGRLLGNNNLKSSIAYRYKDILKANFANVNYDYNANARDYIFRTQLDSLGRTITAIADQHSASQEHSLNAGISRFFMQLKTVVKLNGNVGFSIADYLLNDIMAKQRQVNYGVTLELINNLSSVISADYRTNLDQRLTILAEGRQTKVLYNNHYLNLFFYPFEKHTLILNNAYYGNNIPGQTNQFFLDATYRYHVGKWKADIELTANNLLNNSNYITQISTNFELVQSYFELRPRQIVVSTRFKF